MRDHCHGKWTRTRLLVCKQQHYKSLTVTKLWYSFQCLTVNTSILCVSFQSCTHSSWRTSWFCCRNKMSVWSWSVTVKTWQAPQIPNISSAPSSNSTLCWCAPWPQVSQHPISRLFFCSALYKNGRTITSGSDQIMKTKEPLTTQYPGIQSTIRYRKVWLHARRAELCLISPQTFCPHSLLPDNKSFFVLSMSENGAQIYELMAPTVSDQRT